MKRVGGDPVGQTGHVVRAHAALVRWACVVVVVVVVIWRLVRALSDVDLGLGAGGWWGAAVAALVGGVRGGVSWGLRTGSEVGLGVGGVEWCGGEVGVVLGGDGLEGRMWRWRWAHRGRVVVGGHGREDEVGLFEVVVAERILFRGVYRCCVF